jgi:hypothetical protein
MNILDLKRKLLPMSGPQMDGGGGGGGGSSTGTQTQISELPEWARGYAKSALEKGAALSETPFQAYGGNRIAGFSPLQEQSQQAAANMQTNAGTGAGISGAQDVMGKALNTNYDAGKFTAGQFGNDAAQQYMNPYMQNVVDIQKREANKQAAIQGQQQQAAGVGRGAFGGSRDAMMRSEANRNLNQQLNDIQAVGSSNAYTNAQQQFNADQARNMQAQQLGEQSRQYGAGLGMQGLQTALQGANTMGTLGSQQFQQGMDINKLQNAYGGQQQALRQQGLSQAYQDFQDQKNYPYKQLGFFSDMIRGLPLGQVTSKTMYEPAPGMAQQVASLGTGAYGLSKFMAEGGMAYADGGSVDSADNVSRIVSKLSDQQLQQAAQAAQARGDMDQLEAIQSEMGMRASERNGLASAVTPQMADQMAGGGVVAFADGGYNDALTRARGLAETDLAETPGQRMAGIKSALPDIQAMYGPSATAPYMEDIKKERAGLGKMADQGEGLAWLAASKAILRPGNKARAVSEAMGAFGTEIVKMKKDQRDADRQLRQAELTLATAEQARADGQIGKAESLYDKSQAQKKEGIDRQLSVAEKEAQIQAGIKQAQIQASATLGKATDLDKLTKANFEAMLEAGEPNSAATRAKAAKEAADQLGKYPGSARAEAATTKAIAPEVENALLQNKAYRKAMSTGNYEEAAAIRAKVVNSIKPAESKGDSTPAPQQSAAPIKVTTEAQFAKLRPGTTFIAPDGSTRIKQ